MRPADWIIVIAYFAYVIWEGVRHGRKNVNLDDYFRGQRSLRWWAVGLSVMATQASAITYIGTTGQAYGSGMSFIQVYLPQPLVMVVLCLTFVPLFYRANVFTAYEYLERRFDARTRSLTSFLFLMSRGLSVSIVLYAPSIVLGVIFGWSEVTTILVMGLTTIAYTTVGGNKAVIMVDAKQMMLMFAGIFVAVGFLVARLPGGFSLSDAVHLAGVTGKWNNVDLSLDLTNSYTLLSGMLGGFFLALSYFGCDQSQVQRYLTGKSITQAKLSLLFNAVAKIPMQFMILFTGAMVFVFFTFTKPPVSFDAGAEKRIERAAGYAQAKAEYDASWQARKSAAERLPASTGEFKQAQKRFDESRAQAAGLKRLFVLTTRSAHWFVERGYLKAGVDDLPEEKQALYNYQRKSEVLVKQLA